MRGSITVGTLLRWAFIPVIALLGAFYVTAQPLHETQPTPKSPPSSAPTVSTLRVQPEISDEAVTGFFDDYMSKTINRLDLPGGAVVVVRDGQPIPATGYGYADLASQRPVSIEESLFRGASISKTFTWSRRH